MVTWAGARRSLRANVGRLLGGLDEVQEIYNDQFLYGHREILTTFMHLPRDAVFTGYLPHAGVFDPWPKGGPGKKRDPYGREMRQWVWNRRWCELAFQNGATRAVAIGAPWLYLLDSEDVDPCWVSTMKPHKEPNNGIVFFPEHSWEGGIESVQTFRRDAKALVQEYPGMGITACLYWMDFCRPEVVRVFHDLNIATTCNGVRSHYVPESPGGDRTRFLQNQLALMRNAELIVSSGLSTSLMYGASLGKPVRLGPGTVDLSRYARQLVRFPWLHSSEPVSSDMYGAEVAEELGADCKLTAEELRHVMTWKPLHELRPRSEAEMS